MTEFLIANMAPLMFASMILFLLFGFPVAFALAANGILFGLIGIELGLLVDAVSEVIDIPDRQIEPRVNRRVMPPALEPHRPRTPACRRDRAAAVTLGDLVEHDPGRALVVALGAAWGGSHAPPAIMVVVSCCAPRRPSLRWPTSWLT